MTDVIVVGAGVIGCCLADELTRRGAAVTVVDAAEAGSGTSAATFAWINSNDKTPAEYSDLNVLGLQAHERSLARGGARWFHQTGTVQLAQSDAELGALEEKVLRLSSRGYSAQLLTPAQVRRLEPGLVARGLLGGAHYPREGWTDVATMCLVLLDRAIAAGATFAPYETVTDLRPNEVRTVTADGSTRVRRADLVVLAAGNGTRGILARGGLPFPVLEPTAPGGEGPARGGIISTTSPVDAGVRHLVRATGIALRPARNGGVTFADHPTGGKWDFASPEIWTVPGLLLERARELYPALRDAFTETVSLGTRVLPEDGLTIADWVTTDRSLYAVATHSGVTLAAHLAETVAEEVLTGVRHPSLEHFGLGRFAAA